MGSTRRLAAVMFLDMVGYSALMSRSESQAMTCVKDLEAILRAEVSQILQMFPELQTDILRRPTHTPHDQRRRTTSICSTRDAPNAGARCSYYRTRSRGATARRRTGATRPSDP